MPERLKIETPVMRKNDAIAAQNRERLARLGIFAVNLISSPGSGKTSLLERMAERLGDDLAVIEGDVRTQLDAERVRRAGSRAQQIETGGACHLDAAAVAAALDELRLEELPCRILVIENVGNLVCPASYDLGENMKAAILSLPEGDDKVRKYPGIFHRIGALIINKIDLRPYLEFDERRVEAECRSLNRDFRIFFVSAKTGEGVEELCQYLREKHSALRA